MLTIGEFRKGMYGAPPLTRDCACPPWLVFAAVEAATFPAGLAPQPGARTLCAFFITVSPATLAQRPSPCTTQRTSKSASPLRRKELPPGQRKWLLTRTGLVFTLLQHCLNPLQ